MSDRHPDIEIYLKRAPVPDILDWLGNYFDIVDQKQQGDSHQLVLSYGQSQLQCIIVENAVKGGYVSVWFKQNETPWDTDEACARDAWDKLGVEIRCTVAGWTSESDDVGGWYRFTASGQSVVNWLA